MRLHQRSAERPGDDGRQRPAEAAHPVALTGAERPAVACDDRVARSQLQEGRTHDATSPHCRNAAANCRAIRSSSAKMSSSLAFIP